MRKIIIALEFCAVHHATFWPTFGCKSSAYPSSFGFFLEPKGDVPAARLLRKELVHMVTYGDLFNFVIMLCAVITLVIYAKRKK